MDDYNKTQLKELKSDLEGPGEITGPNGKKIKANISVREVYYGEYDWTIVYTEKGAGISMEELALDRELHELDLRIIMRATIRLSLGNDI